MITEKLKQHLKNSESPVVKSLVTKLKLARQITIPPIKIIYAPLFFLHHAISNFCTNVMRIAYWTPLFLTRVYKKPKYLFLYGGMPMIIGPLTIELGNNCRISGHTTFSGRSTSSQPTLYIGNNVGIGWQTTIAVGTKVIIGDYARIAGGGFLAGYPGHPIAARERALDKPDKDEQCGDIILEESVWLGTGVKVMPGVTIGKNTIVAAGSIVTKSLPANVIAAGVPAKIVRAIDEND